MSKNIIIQEGGTAKQMTVKKLKTDTVGGGSCLWVPEEEVPLGTKSVTANGTYKASDDGKYGFSQFTVNVPGGAGSANADGTPHTNPDIGSGTDPGTGGGGTVDPGTVDPGTVDPGTGGGGGGTVDPGTVDPGTGGGGTVDPGTVDPSTGEGSIWIPPGGPGSAVTGTDPETGENAIIGIDENSNIVYTSIPSSVSVITPPSKTTYKSGDTIDFSGLVVGLKMNSGNTFTNARYSNGHIPMGELIFPVNTVPDSNGESNGNQSPEGFPSFKTVSISSPAPAPDVYGKYLRWKTSGSGTIGAVVQENSVLPDMGAVIVYSDAPFMTSATYGNTKEGTEPNILVNTGFTYDGKTAYYERIGATKNTASTNGATDRQVAWTALYGTPSGGGDVQSIPVQWKSPYDGRTFEATFEITVTGSSGSGSTDGSGYSDDSGGSASGGGGRF